MTSDKVDEILDSLNKSIELEVFKMIVANSINKCYSKCVSKPGTKLDSYQKLCLTQCVDRYKEAYGLVAQAITQHDLTRE